MGSDPADNPISIGVAVLLVALPVVAGGLLLVVFDAGAIHRLGLFMVGAGVIVGAAVLMLRSGWV